MTCSREAGAQGHVFFFKGRGCTSLVLVAFSASLSCRALRRRAVFSWRLSASCAVISFTMRVVFSSVVSVRGCAVVKCDDFVSLAITKFSFRSFNPTK